MSDVPVQGVHALDHTADIGLEIEAPDLAELLRRAALGLTWLLTEAPPGAVSEERHLSVEASDSSALLREWLRELLHWHEEDGFLAVEVRMEAAGGGRADGVVQGGIPESAPIREIKGVTLHELVAEPATSGWCGRVVFDV